MLGTHQSEKIGTKYTDYIRHYRTLMDSHEASLIELSDAISEYEKDYARIEEEYREYQHKYNLYIMLEEENVAKRK